MNVVGEMEVSVRERVRQMAQSDVQSERVLAEYIDIASKTIKCWGCLDTRRCWKVRDNVFWARMDNRGDYDIMTCPHCNHGNAQWVSCSKENDVRENGIRLFELWHTPSVSDVCDQLKVIYEHVKQLKHVKQVKQVTKTEQVEIETHKTGQREEEESTVAEWLMYEQKTVEYIQKSIQLDIDIGEIAKAVCNAIKTYGGDFFALADIAKDMTVNMAVGISSEVGHNESIRSDSNMNPPTYVLLKCDKSVSTTKLETGWFKADKLATKFKVDITIIRPKNKAAQAVVQSFVSDKISEKIQGLRETF